jgi:hypothetical protein
MKEEFARGKRVLDEVVARSPPSGMESYYMNRVAVHGIVPSIFYEWKESDHDK